MNTQTDETLDQLNHLVEICKDGAHGFNEAAEDAKDPELRMLFQKYSSERQVFADKLAELIRQAGGDPDKAGSVTGAMHRGWINLKAALSSDEPHAVLAECERGEDAAVSAYRSALEQLSDPTARELVSHQFASVLAAHDHVRSLRDSAMYQTR